jgi:hypothetical protein
MDEFIKFMFVEIMGDCRQRELQRATASNPVSEIKPSLCSSVRSEIGSTRIAAIASLNFAVN